MEIKMEKIELNKRTLRTLSMSELTMIGGASEDGDEDPAQPIDDNDQNAATKTKPAPQYTTNCPSSKCPIASQICPPSNDRKCCPNTGS